MREVRRRKGTPREERSLSFESVFARAASTLPRRLLIGAISAVLVLVCLATALAWREYQDARRRALNEVRARAVLAGTVFDTYFAGELGTLTSVAASPTVTAGDTNGMRSYFARVQPAHGTLFTGGLGWIDIHGVSRVSSNPPPAGPLINVSDRSYFKTVITTGRPFISEGLRTKRGKQRVIVMAVPTRDAGGQLNGVLAGALLLQQSTTDQRSIDLGYERVVVIDRRGQQITTPTFRPARKRAAAAPAATRRRGSAPGHTRPRRRVRARRRVRDLQGSGLDDRDRQAALGRVRAGSPGPRPGTDPDRGGRADRVWADRLGDSALASRCRGRAGPGAGVGRARPIARGRVRRHGGLGRAQLGSRHGLSGGHRRRRAPRRRRDRPHGLGSDRRNSSVRGRTKGRCATGAARARARVGRPDRPRECF